MIGRWIDAQDDEVLGHIERAKGGWCIGDFVNEHGERCLIGHVLQAGQPGDTGLMLRLAGHFDNLCERFGTARIGRLISERARRVLEERREKRRLDELDALHLRRELAELRVPVSVHVSLNCEPVEVGA